ncbi:MAG: hypothetical protein NC217_07400 [Muribaculaceae bacterium]|nr:hypothetical protein [Muribaculaceae bacterium]
MQLILLFILTFIGLLAIELIYIPLARKNRWSTERNRREDSHPVTVIGGGIIFYISMVIWCLALGIIYNQVYLWSNFIVGITMLAACSFADDILQLKVWIRLVVQFVAVTFLGLQCGAFNQEWYIWLMLLLCTVGFVNGYNFMDGINGITAAYSIAVLGLFLYVDMTGTQFVPGSMIAMAIISVIIFAFFNFRKRPVVFAGDVGSITMGYIVATVLIYYILQTHTLTALIMVSVYGVDTFMTVVRRASEGENIFKPHRKHIYQLLNYVWRCSQLRIAVGYALLQLGISIGYLYMRTNEEQIIYCAAVLICLTGLYFILMMASENKRRRIELLGTHHERDTAASMKNGGRSRNLSQGKARNNSEVNDIPLPLDKWN